MTLLKLSKMESGSWRRPISLQVEEKEIVLLLGRNGAGKTTLLNTIAGLVPLNSGRIDLNGIDVTHFDEIGRSNHGIRIALEGRQIFPRLSVRKNLLLGAYNNHKKKESYQTMDWVISVFPDLRTKLNAIAVTLSGGQQTQLNVGRALMGNPKLLLLDEPTLGLDPQNVNKLINALKLIQVEKNVTILIAEQGGALTRTFSQRIILIAGGEILFDGSWERAEKEKILETVLP